MTTTQQRTCERLRWMLPSEGCYDTSNIAGGSCRRSVVFGIQSGILPLLGSLWHPIACARRRIPRTDRRPAATTSSIEIDRSLVRSPSQRTNLECPISSSLVWPHPVRRRQHVSAGFRAIQIADHELLNGVTTSDQLLCAVEA
jgi:hypothetical protein